MAVENAATGSKPEVRGLQYWMERVLKEKESVRKAPDPDAVHDLRVAIRRCRSVAAVMEEVDPDSAWPDMRKLGRKLFRQLGELRDTQVLEEWTKQLGPEADLVRERLLAAFAAEEKEQQESALKAVDKFDEKSWRKLERKLQRRSRLVPPDGLAAECLALERLEAARELHVRALRAEKAEAWHALRIGVKRFRYTVESLLPTRYEEWGEQLKRVQDLLGEVHDLDVLATRIAEVAEDLEEPRRVWGERIAAERHERIELYRKLALGESSLWQTWRRGLPEGKRLASAAQARLRSTARALEVNTRRATLVSRLAIRLYDGLAKVQAAGPFSEKELRKIMLAAARLHAIGVGLDAKSPQKAARKHLRGMALPSGWTETEWETMTNIIRYHRGGLPDAESKSLARLSPEERKRIACLAGVLRLARSLSKSRVATATGLRVEKSVDAIIVNVPGLEESEANAARLATGKYLLESNLGLPVIVKAVPLAPKLVHLPRREEPPQANAVA